MKFQKVKQRIFKPIPELNAEIRIIENEQLNNEEYWIGEVGLCESMGERGYNYTFLYSQKPTEETIIADIKKHIKNQIKDFEKGGYLNHYEQEQLRLLKEVEKNAKLV